MGLLDSVIEAAKQQYQTTKRGFGLLASNPQQFAQEATTRYFPTKEEEAQFAQAQAAGGDYTQTPYYQKIMDLSQFQGSIKPTGLLGDAFNIVKRDASDTFGAGSERIRYIEPKSGGAIEVLSKPDKTASVLSLEVPEAFRGKKIGESLQAKVLQDFPLMQGQISSKAAAKTAYRLGRRPVGLPNATLDDVFKSIDENSSVNMVSPQMQSVIQQRMTPER